MTNAALIQGQSKPAKVELPPQEERLFVPGGMAPSAPHGALRYVQRAMLPVLPGAENPTVSDPVISFESVARAATFESYADQDAEGYRRFRNAENLTVHGDLAEASRRTLPAE